MISINAFLNTHFWKGCPLIVTTLHQKRCTILSFFSLIYPFPNLLKMSVSSDIFINVKERVREVGIVERSLDSSLPPPPPPTPAPILYAEQDTLWGVAVNKFVTRTVVDPWSVKRCRSLAPRWSAVGGPRPTDIGER